MVTDAIAPIAGEQFGGSMEPGGKETLTVAGFATLAFLALRRWVPRTDSLHGVQGLSSLRKPAVWGMMLVAALGVASIFAVYTFISPFAWRLKPGSRI